MVAALFQVADQPLLRRRAWGCWWTFTGSIRSTSLRWVTTVSGGNPCLFPARLFPELLALQGDHGGNQVIRRHEEDLLLWEVRLRN